MEATRIWNPPNPYLTEHRELLGEPQPVDLEVYEDTSQSILSHNDSPDISFRWSVNPYRGCFHACLYCMLGDTPIAMGDDRTKPLADVRVGDEIYGVVLRERYRYFVKTHVLAHWSVIKPAYRIILEDGTQLITSADHRFLTQRGWKHVVGTEQGRTRRPHLTVADKLFAVDPAITRKRAIEGQVIKNHARLRVASIENLRLSLPMFDIMTGTGNFIANGVVSHNCYARPTHEYFGLGAGSDFERKIFVKRNAPALLEQAFRRKSWVGERIVFSGVTDCYQPLEAAWKLTRGCLEVCLNFLNPAAIITKSLLIRRDIDLLKQLAQQSSVTVSISIPFLDEEVARAVEPGAPKIARRFEAIALLAEAGVPVGIGVAPIIPGLNDRDIPGLLREAKRCGAKFAFRTLLRLPGSVGQVFFHRIREKFPDRAGHIESLIRGVRGGRLYDSRFGFRHEGSGPYWDAIDQVWELWTRRSGFNEDFPERPSAFRRPPEAGSQMEFQWLE